MYITHITLNIVFVHDVSYREGRIAFFLYDKMVNVCLIIMKGIGYFPCSSLFFSSL